MTTQNEQQFLEKYPKIKDVMDNPALSNHQKRQALKPYASDMRKRRNELENELSQNQEQLKTTESAYAMYTEVKEWLDRIDEDKNLSIERNDCSRLHKLIKAIGQGKVHFVNEEEAVFNKMDALWEMCHAFIVEHDWAQAFKGASDYEEGEIQIPYPVTAFEFRIAGKSVINIAVQNDDEGKKIIDSSFVITPFVLINGSWLCLGDEVKENKGFIMLYEEIKAISVALEAEIAIETIVRAPAKLNKKRKEKGELPLFDYHIVDLNRRYSSRFNGEGTHRSPRFHFRRGHWRHFEKHKTYIKWTLVGNPELGFIDKYYKL